MPADIQWIRNHFPSLAHEINGQPIVFFDAPGGTQVPRTVMQAISDYLLKSNANSHGAFVTSQQTDALMNTARHMSAALLGCAADEVVFGANMTTLTFALSRAIGRELQPGDEIIVTKLDHYANVSSWQALAERGVVIHAVGFNPEDCTLNLAELEQLLNQRTRLVAVGYASNAVGTINDVKTIVQMAHQVGALVYVDAVHYAPHGAIDVHSLDCDFLTCSAYKFFGPHVGILYGKQEHLTRLSPYKVQPAPTDVPCRWETGTPNYEGLAGLVESIHYLSDLGYHVCPTSENHRAAILAAMAAIQSYEQELSHVLMAGLLQIPGLTVYGITEPDRFHWRTPTVGIRLNGYPPDKMAKQLGDRGIFTWNGNFYALGVTETLGLESSGGLLRIGLVHYNTIEEIQCFLKALDEIVAPSTVCA
ncbi:MAG: cysteine desulfurase-like protein [Cyanobacteria bacterium CRU_2_1]|nr:cysteine desulfurase-like protein [Cyanobacteria bacterium RU_5_0]NJR59256.1 cysteine desulfurase-like protein [Cyanobacteria bacterium CRU_2_1]